MEDKDESSKMKIKSMSRSPHREQEPYVVIKGSTTLASPMTATITSNRDIDALANQMAT